MNARVRKRRQSLVEEICELAADVMERAADINDSSEPTEDDLMELAAIKEYLALAANR